MTVQQNTFLYYFHNIHLTLVLKESQELTPLLKMKSFVTIKGDKLVKTDKFKIREISEKDKERIYEIVL